MYMLPHDLFFEYGNSYHSEIEEKIDNRVYFIILNYLKNDHFKVFSFKIWFSNTIELLQKDIFNKKDKKMLIIITLSIK